MQQAISAALIDRGSSRARLVESLTAAAVIAVALGAFLFLFNRSNVLSHSIGYNLYASERVLEGNIPYRDFHTLYPLAIFYVNAAVFKWLGVSLYYALAGVLIFKVLTVLVIYLNGRQVMPRGWALAAALSGLLWLRPNGPFKPVPMHYGALFLALAMLLLLKYENRQKLKLVFLAGASLGLVALFKHNIGAYAIAGTIAVLLFEVRGDARQMSLAVEKPDSTRSHRLRFARYRSLRPVLALLTGCAATLVPALAYMRANDALAPMIRTLLFGPGEFLLSRLAIPLSPVAPVVLVTAIVLITWAAHRLPRHPAIATAMWVALIAGISLFILRGNQADVNQIIFYLPVMTLACGFVIAIFGDIAVTDRRSLVIAFIFAAAALMEAFPRFAREQSIAAMPLTMLFLVFLLYVLRPAIRGLLTRTLQYRLALAVLPITFVLIEARMFIDTYFDNHIGFRANTELKIDRGRGVYFPAATAALIEAVVNYVEQRIPPGGYAFAQSDAGTSFLFLSDRRNISNAQFWIGVGVTPEERAATLDRIDKTQTKLIITSDEVLAAEKYGPMRDYIEQNFKVGARFDDVLILER
ncbi:MAG: glycosyltransferase family 39 protein [Blastocatellia bacterium]